MFLPQYINSNLCKKKEKEKKNGGEIKSQTTKSIWTFQIKLVNINSSDLVDGRPPVVLGLIWTIILYFQVCCTYESIW